MNEYIYPENFEELVYILEAMDEDQFADNDDTGHLRYVEIVNMEGGRYGMYEDHEWVGCSDDVIAVANFLAEGWEF